MIEWFIAFIATCAIELVIVTRLGPRHPRRVAVVCGAQLFTHPFVWLAMATLPGSQLVRLAVVELWATLVETAVYKRFFALRGRDAFALSAIANAGSLLFVSGVALLL